MPREILGLAMPFRLEGGVVPAPASTDDSIRASIERIIHTRRGERAMRPDVGSRCWEFVYENVGSLAAGRLKAEIRGALAAQEPRIRVLAVDVVPFDQLPEYPDGAGFRVDITYRLGGEVETVSTTFDTGTEPGGGSA